MNRVSTTIIVFFTFFTAASNLFEETGVTAAMGINTGVSAGQKLNEALTAMEQIRGSAGTVESLFSIYAMIGSTLEAFFVGVSAGPRILAAAGVPGFLLAFLFAPAVIFVGIDLIYALSGRDM